MIQYCWAFCEWYLYQEVMMHCWVQVGEEIGKQLEQEGEIVTGSGYYYNCPLTFKKMVEFQVDASEKLLKYVAGDLGGNLSVRLPQGEKPLICFGPDEFIYKQFLLTKMS
jgi:hypothetical protein